MNIHIIYHRRCSDGLMAAAIAGQAAHAAGVTPTYHDAQYGEAPPVLPKDADVIIVDFSYPADVLAEMARSVRSVTVLDHHASAIDKLADWPPTPNVMLTLDTTRSGAMLAWEHFFAGKIAPLAVRLVQDRDLWTWKLEHTRAFSFALRSLPTDSPDGWRQLLTNEPLVNRMIDEGRAVEAYYDEQLASVVPLAKPCIVNGVKGYAVNANGMFASDAGHELAKRTGSRFGLVWYMGADGSVKVSFRGTDGETARKLAESFGGGGHGNAAGCTMTIYELLAALAMGRPE